MVKFKDITQLIADYLANNLSNVSIESGKYGEMPSITPTVWIYIEPYRNMLTNVNTMPIVKNAKVTLFAIADASTDKYKAMINSVELIEQVESTLFTNEFEDYINNHSANVNQLYTSIKYADEQSLNFDNIYSDYAVAYLEIIIPYV